MLVERRVWRWVPGVMFLLCSLLSGGAVAASDEDQAADYYESALAHFEAGRYDSAVIELKNAVQLVPSHLPSRILLGRTHLVMGDAATAEKELRAATELGADPDLIAVPLADAMIGQAHFKELIAELSPGSLEEDVQADAYSRLGIAYTELKEWDKAERQFELALRLDPRHAKAMSGEVTLLLRRGRLAEAEQKAEEIVVNAPSAVEGWLVKASIALLKGDLKQALRHYEHVLLIKPDHLEANVRRAAMLLELAQYAKVVEVLEPLLEEFNWDPRIPYMLARAHHQLGHAEAAAEALKKADELVLLVTPEQMAASPDIKLMVGVVASLSGRHEQAVEVFSDLALFNGLDAVSTKLYASSLLAMGRDQRAIDVLLPLEKQRPSDVQVLVLLGEAHEKLDRHEEAMSYYRKALKRNPSAMAVIYRLAALLEGLGDYGAGIELLAPLLEKNPEDVKLRGRLAQLFLRNGEANRAEQVLQPVVAEHGDKPDVINLRAGILMAQGRKQEADALYVRLSNDFQGFQAAELNRARLAETAGRLEEAEHIYRQVLAASPGQGTAARNLAQMLVGHGRVQEAAGILEQASRDRPQDTLTAVDLAGLYIKLGNVDSALGLALNLNAEAPRNPMVKRVLAQVYMAQGKREIAAKSLSDAAQLASGDADLLASIARWQLAIGDRSGARQTLNRALNAQAAHVEARVLLVRLDIQDGRFPDARRHVGTLLSHHPDNFASNGVLGDLEMAQKHYDKAVAAYRKAGLESSVLARMVQALRAAGREQEVPGYLQQAMEQRPDARVARHLLAEHWLAAGDVEAAIGLYEKLLAENAEDRMALNNLAQIYIRSTPEKAVPLAERAYQIAAEDPSVADTYGWALVSAGRAEEGLRYLREALTRKSTSPSIRYHLAKALADLGRDRQAQEELRSVLRVAGDFPERGAAESLDRKLKAKP